MAEQAEAPAAAPSQLIPILKQMMRRGDIAFAIAMIGILMVLLFPVSTVVLDFLLTISITSAVLIFMTTLFINKPLDFSAFPTILLITAILRLALNIASTRLILAEGHTGTASAGHVIEAFGTFVMAGNVVIGAIVFGILTIINFVVITKGSGRIAEVAARFSLDAMPGKQMAIDADLSAGLIDEAAAKVRRKELEDESTFFGSMDGANKFVRGDAVAALLITFINFIAGIIIGVVQRDMSFSDALHAYTTLTIGDGLVAQIPSLVISLSAGLLVTKSGVSGSADKAIFEQLSRHPQALALCSVLLLAMGAMPAMPAFPFIILSMTTGGIAWFMTYGKKIDTPAAAAKKEEAAKKEDAAKAATAEESITDTLHIDSIRLELGYGLLPLINYQKGHRLTEQIKALRKQMARDLGFVIPSVRIQDNMQLPTNGYVIRVKEIECGKGEIRADMLLVMDPQGGEISIPGEKTTEPAFGLPAHWVADNYREEALFRNYTVVDPPTVITTHLTEVIKDNITDLLSYTETQKLMDDMGDEHKKLISDTVPSQISVSGMQRVLQNLLAEMISIRDMPAILESLAEASRISSNITVITEHVRSRLARQISHANTTDDGFIPILALSPLWEQVFTESIVGNGDDKQLSIAPTKLQEFITAARKKYEDHGMRGETPVLLVSPNIRPYVRSIIERFRPSTVVMSQNEIHPKAKIKTIGQL